MDTLGTTIENMLNLEDRKVLAAFDEKNIVGQLGSLFHGKDA
ncbi:MAG: hypothetical protein ABGW81_10250 [Paracoccaceae bacterium]